MKHFLIFAAIVTVITYLSCNSSSHGIKPYVLRSDTTYPLAVYKNLYNQKVEQGILKRVVKDGLLYVYADTNENNKRKWGKDTSYILTISLPIDSARSKELNKPIKDSTGKQNYVYYDIPTAKRFVRSGWNGVDTVLINGLKVQQ